MYQPAQGPQRRSSRSGLSALAVTLMCTVSMLAGCVGGALVASAPDPSTTAAASPSPTQSSTPSATPHQARAAVSEGPSAQETGRSATPRRTATRTAKPTPRRTTVKPKPKRTTAPSVDPRFRTCAAAKRAGYGPYRRGVDPEYAWYQDRDDDGTVCE
jgi:hypothetical protein